jgi:hypothetical protein
MPSELNILRAALDQWIKENPVVRRYQILDAAQTLEVLDIAAKLQVPTSAQSQAPDKPPAPVPAQLHDYFARDRSGKVPSSAPTGANLQTVRITHAAESVDRKHLKVTFDGGKANCFDRELWPRLTRLTGHEAQLWIAEKGDFLNIMGVRA